MTQTTQDVVSKTILAVNADVTKDTAEGVWTLCLNPFDNPVQHFFYRRKITDKYFAENDKTSICSLCWRKAQEKNGTLPKRDANMANYVHHKSIESKPEPDSL